MHSARTAIGALVAAATLMGASASHAEDRHVRIINETSHTMVSFYASNTARNSWEEDILGREELGPGQDVNINIDDGSGHCLFDFKAVFDNGQVLIRHNINVCETSSYRYTE
jgi:ABC-type glycerol-3-phosphate transport system substrate-binding protein